MKDSANGQAAWQRVAASVAASVAEMLADPLSPLEVSVDTLPVIYEPVVITWNRSPR